MSGFCSASILSWGVLFSPHTHHRAQTASPSSLPKKHKQGLPHAATYEAAQGIPETLLSPGHQLPPAQHPQAAEGGNNEVVADSAQGAILLKVSPCGQTAYQE